MPTSVSFLSSGHGRSCQFFSLSCRSRRGLVVRTLAGKPDPKGGPSTDDILKAGVDLAKTYLSTDPKWRLATDVAAKLLNDPSAPSSEGLAKLAARSSSKTEQWPGSGVYVLVVLLASVFVVQNDFAHAFFTSLQLHHSHLSTWQFATASFFAGSWVQLSSALFLVYVFGRTLEDYSGFIGLWAAYLLCGLGASLAAYTFFPAKIGKVALVTGTAVYAAFGVFVASQIITFRALWQKVIEVAIISQFVIRIVATETTAAGLPYVAVMGHSVAPALLAMLGSAAGAVAYILLLQLWNSVASSWSKRR